MRHLLAFLAGVAVTLMIVAATVLFTSDQVRRSDELPTAFSSATYAVTNTVTLTEAQRKANRYWKGTRCVNRIALERRRLAANKIAVAHWYFNRSVPTVFINCKVTFQTQNFSRAVTCAAMIHEYGHLNGRAHSRDPRNVMYHTLTSRNIPRVCR
jgi:hypothetical protein